MKYKDLSRIRELRPKQVARSNIFRPVKALFDNSDNVFDREETVMDDEDESESEDEVRV